jgi:8-oxo-dGTP pyrophosphatase MutT (NUDIX family)
MAAIRPAGRPAGTWVLPKGLIEPGESGEQAALRETMEETGVQGRTLARLRAVQYWFSSDGERVLKTVSFYLMAYRSGRVGRLPAEAAGEVAATGWLPLAEAPLHLAYRGEREVAAEALAVLEGRQSV